MNTSSQENPNQPEAPQFTVEAAPISAANPSTAEDTNIPAIMWIATVFFGFIPPLIGYLVYGQKPLMRQHSLAGLNFSITYMLVLFVASLLSFLLIGFLVFPVAIVWALYVCIKGAITASKGETFVPPFTLNLLK